MRLSHRYDKRFLLKCLFWLGVIMLAMWASNGIGFIIAVPMILWALGSGRSEQLFFWLLLVVTMLMGNQALMPKSIVFAVTQRGLMLLLGCLMSVRLVGVHHSHLLRPFVFMLVYILFMFIPSAAGWNPMISYMKLFLFTIIYFAYLGISNEVAMSPRASTLRMRSAALSVAIFFIVGSMVLVPFPGISMMQADAYLTNPDLPSLFKGMTMHSQSLGPIVSVLSVLIFADMLFSVKHTDALYILLLVCCPYLIYRTSSRTGMGAYLLGMMYVMFLFMRARGVAGGWRSRVVTTMMVLVAIGAVALLCSPSGQRGIRRFVLKSRDQAMTTENLMSTRQGNIDFALNNFKKKPLIGNGFQVSLALEGDKPDSLKSMLSAPIEKGVWVTAVLEEGGAIGFSIFLIFLLTCILGSIRRRAYVGSSCLFVMMLTNLGEFTFFSMSYTGGFCWAIVFAGLAMDAQRIREEQRAAQQQYQYRLYGRI